MKIIVDELPYYGDSCPFENYCTCQNENCPRNWDKRKVCSNDNPGECELLVEIEKLLKRQRPERSLSVHE